MKLINRILAIIGLMAMAFAAPLSIATFTTGCAETPLKLTYQTLGTVGTSVDASMKIAAAAKVKGVINDAQWAQISDKQAKYLVAYNAAIDLAATATTTGLNTPATADLVALASDLTSIISTFTK